MTQQTKTYLVAGIGIVVIVGLIWWGSQQQSAPSGSEDTGKELHIGAILPLTGSAAYYGEQSRRGVDLAVKELEQENPGLVIDLIYDDSFYTPKGAVDAYQAIKRKAAVDAVVTMASHVSAAVQPLANQDGVLQMGISNSASSYTSFDDLSFRSSATAHDDTAVLVDYVNQQGYERLAGVYLNNDFGISFWEALQKNLEQQAPGVEVVNDEASNLDNFDFRSSLTKIKTSNADVVFVVATAAHLSELLTQAAEVGLDAQIISARSAEDPVLLTNAGRLAEGVIYSYGFDEASPQAKNFTQNFLSEYGTIPDQYAAEAYEGLRLAVFGLMGCDKGDTACIKGTLHNLKGYDSVFGSLSYDENGDVSYDYFLKTVKDGRFVTYDPTN